MSAKDELEVESQMDWTGWYREGKQRGLWKSVVSATKNYGRVMLDEWQGISMEITKYGIAAPPPHNVNIVRVGAADKEGHRTTASSNFIGIYTTVAGNGKGRWTQETGDYNGGHVLTTAAPVEGDVQGCVARSVVHF